MNMRPGLAPVTAAALATLVDQGKIDWDDKVIDRLPGFQMWDSWVTREMTIRDLLVHRSGLGLGAGDLLFVPRSNLSRAEAVRRLRYIKPATSFRSDYAYDPFMRLYRLYFPSAITRNTANTSDYEEYGYDANGNIINKTGVGHYQYNVSGKSNRLAAVWQNSNFSNVP